MESIDIQIQYNSLMVGEGVVLLSGRGTDALSFFFDFLVCRRTTIFFFFLKKKM